MVLHAIIFLCSICNVDQCNIKIELIFSGVSGGLIESFPLVRKQPQSKCQVRPRMLIQLHVYNEIDSFFHSHLVLIYTLQLMLECILFVMESRNKFFLLFNLFSFLWLQNFNRPNLWLAVLSLALLFKYSRAYTLVMHITTKKFLLPFCVSRSTI